MISDVWTHDIDGTSLLPKGGSNYGSVNPTNPSYFAPAMYKEFSKVDTGHNWTGVVSAVYAALNSLSGTVTGGLVPAWCTNNCTAAGTNGAATDGEYQYDSHRVPWRIGTDACWNGETRAATYLNAIVGFFSSASATAGLSSLADIYMTNGTKDANNSAPNSMSLIGCAGVGAMSVSSAASFRDRAWQFLLDGEYTDSPSFLGNISGSKGGYTYYNATVGLLTMLTMSGNFYPM
jgi:hypothetical protein